MKTIDVEKALHLAGALDLKEVVMKDNFLYRQEQDGIRCLGPFYLRGRYTTLDGEKDFQDVFEFDVFAANEKLDGEEFKIAFDDYDYTLQVIRYNNLGEHVLQLTSKLPLGSAYRKFKLFHPRMMRGIWCGAPGKMLSECSQLHF